MKLTVILENEGGSWGAYTPDDAYCIVATGRSRASVLKRFRAGLALYLEYLRAEGRPVPEITELEIRETVSAAPDIADTQRRSRPGGRRVSAA